MKEQEQPNEKGGSLETAFRKTDLDGWQPPWTRDIQKVIQHTGHGFYDARPEVRDDVHAQLAKDTQRLRRRRARR